MEHNLNHQRASLQSFTAAHASGLIASELAALPRTGGSPIPELNHAEGSLRAFVSSQDEDLVASELAALPRTGSSTISQANTVTAH